MPRTSDYSEDTGHFAPNLISATAATTGIPAARTTPIMTPAAKAAAVMTAVAVTAAIPAAVTAVTAAPAAAATAMVVMRAASIMMIAGVRLVVVVRSEIHPGTGIEKTVCGIIPVPSASALFVAVIFYNGLNDDVDNHSNKNDANAH